MGKLSETFTAAYQKIASQGIAFSDDHRHQLDALGEFVDELNATGNFVAKLADLMSAGAPVLKIRDKATDFDATFFISYGSEPLSERPTLKFSTTLARVPFGSKKDGYNLHAEGDWNVFLNDIGTAFADRVLQLSLQQETVNYFNTKKGVDNTL